ncbi:hypothetical protein RND81_06G226900 [Saponaria officinalis]|uniref:Exostosin GT47 domain-containing protein n=1 Tax=Saponaria officinalis TaxID=3572 RepID=A0AAW1K9P9_SAPOF
MNKLLKRLLVILYKFDWKKLFLVLATTTVVGLVLQISLLPFPLLTWLHSPLVRVSTVSNSLQLRLRHEEHWPLRQIALPVLLNSSSELIRDVLKVEEKHRSSRRRRGRRKRKNQEDELLVSLPPPVPRTPPTALQRRVWSLSPNEALLYAKRELNQAQISAEDTDLYAPIFKNATLFQRSYELMELILKVYIYPDGEAPIFHEPHLSGIYASEGWFMKLLHENRQFVTRDPEKAHLFYLPYSARQLQQALYVQGSHNLAPLSFFLRDYVNSLAAKYPFWNRTHGFDHFLVACHDWGPYTLKEHEELITNTIKALCNADLSEGIFKSGKDVSLPETTIRRPRRPLRNIGGGVRVSQRPILAFFAGNMHGRVRPLLLKHWHNKDDQLRIYGPLPRTVSRQMTYIQHMKSSKFCVCPMGFEVNSPRIVEAIYYECVPVIIADNFVPPFDDVLDWSAFSVMVAEKDIPKLKEILEAIPLRRYLKMLANLKMLQRHFLWNLRPVKYDLFHMILHSIWLSRLNQVQIPE